MADIAEVYSDSSATPSPDWFTRSCLESGIDPAEFDKILYCTEPSPLRSPQARYLAALGLSRKARRLEDCGHFGHVQGCVKGHKTKCVYYCGECACIGCAERKSRELIARFKPHADFFVAMAHVTDADPPYPYRFTSLELEIPEPADGWNPESNRAAVENINTTMEKLTGLRQRWTWDAGINTNKELVVRVLSVDNGTIPAAVFKAQWPDSRVSVSICPMHLIYNFFKRLFAVVLPHGAEARAEMELAFTGVRRLRTTGMLRLEIGEINVEDTNPTDNSPEESPTQPSHSHRHTTRCPICKGNIVSRSRIFNILSESGLMASLEMYPIDH